MSEVKECGVDMEPEEFPGRYICDVVSKLPHHKCGMHHDPERISCDETAEMQAVDEELMRYAN